MFHKTVHKAWNLFKHSEQLLENSAKIQFSCVLINRKKLSINWKIFSIDRTRIKNQSKQVETFPHHFDQSNKFWPIENPGTWIFINKILELKFPLYSFYKWWILSNLISLLQPILVYIYIYNNPPLGCNNICLTWLTFYHA